MENVYSFIEANGAAAQERPQEQFDKEAWKERKQQERDATYALGDETALHVNADPAARDGYLEVMARFPERSALNSLLVYAQRPDATRIGTKEDWDKEHARIRKGERGFTLIERGDAYERDDGSLGNFYDATR